MSDAQDRTTNADDPSEHDEEREADAMSDSDAVLPGDDEHDHHDGDVNEYDTTDLD